MGYDIIFAYSRLNEQIYEYYESIVKRMVEKITVNEENFIVEFKSGTSVNVER